ncbi:hypothetical protein L7F22_006431 [Adiantum nelumboides]|nr:hypothetical protein [Adiantum nelumboides]
MSATCSSAPATPMSVELETEPKKIVTLQSSDGELFEVELEVALLSQTIKNIVEDLDDYTSTPLPLPNVSSKELVRVLEFCRYHQQHGHGRPQAPADGVDAANRVQHMSFSEKNEIEQWNIQFLLPLELRPDVYDLMLAARDLNIESLVDVICRRVADAIIACKTPEEVKALLPEKEAAIERENQWAYNN